MRTSLQLELNVLAELISFFLDAIASLDSPMSVSHHFTFLDVIASIDSGYVCNVCNVSNVLNVSHVPHVSQVSCVKGLKFVKRAKCCQSV